ncbi:MAG TPA: hypothetical protein VMT12_00605 [Syntrophales bacterium]|nr:hypothetical protein [Syntrophales bacterium]
MHDSVDQGKYGRACSKGGEKRLFRQHNDGLGTLRVVAKHNRLSIISVLSGKLRR